MIRGKKMIWTEGKSSMVISIQISQKEKHCNYNMQGTNTYSTNRRQRYTFKEEKIT